MKRWVGPSLVLPAQAARRWRRAARTPLLPLLVLIPLMLFLAWPYVTLWRIDRAVRSDDMAMLDELVDLSSIRAQIKKKLNKDANSTIGPLSDAFIRWLASGIAQTGTDAVERLVTLRWVRDRLLDHSNSEAGQGFIGAITYAFFDAPNGFVVRIGPDLDTPVRVRMSLRDLQWRVVALYY